MSLDLVLFRDDQGGDSTKMKDIQSKRFKDVKHVEKVVEIDTKWRKREFTIATYIIVQHLISFDHYFTSMYIIMAAHLLCADRPSVPQVL